MLILGDVGEVGEETEGADNLYGLLTRQAVEQALESLSRIIVVVTAEFDPLRDEGEYYAERLRQAGVPTEMKRWDGMNHGFFFWPGVVDRATDAMDEACEWVKSVLSR